jgi:O-antigen/teichoic acid export membrane protein
MADEPMADEPMADDLMTDELVRRDAPSGRRSFLGAALSLGATNLLGPLAGLATSPILARELGPAGRGELAAALAPLLLVVAGLTFGLPEALTHGVASGRLGSRTALLAGTGLLALAGGLGTLLIILLLTDLAAGSGSAQRGMLIAAGAAVPTLVVAGWRAVHAAQFDWRRLNQERTIAAAAKIVSVAALALLGRLTVVTGTIAMAWLPLMSGCVYLRRRTILRRRNLRARPAGAGAAFLVQFGGRFWIGSVAGVLLVRLDQVLLVPLSSAEQLGLYAVAVNIGEVPVMVSLAARDAILAYDSAAPSNDLVARAARIAVLATCCVAVPLALVLPWGIPFVFGSSYSGSVLPCLFILLSAIAGAGGSVAGGALSARNSPGRRSTCLLAAAAVNAGALILLAPVMGALGAAAATLIGTIVASYGVTWMFCRQSGERFSALAFPRPSDVASIYAALSRTVVPRSGQITSPGAGA